MKMLGIIGFVLTALVIGACGGATSDGHEGNPASSELGFEWGVISVPSRRSVKLGGGVDYCRGSPRPAIAKPQVRYRGRRVYIRLQLKRGKSDEDIGLCAGVELLVTRTIGLRRPVDDLVIYDSDRHPPRKVWPEG